MNTLVDNPVALIFGGTRGIGLAAAKRFASANYNVAIAGRDSVNGEQALKALRSPGSDSMFIPVDVQHVNEIDHAVRTVTERWGRLDCAFNNAGWEGVAGPVEAMTENDWQAMIDIKLNGTWRCVRAELLQMRRQRRGSIVNMAGNWGLVGFPNYSAYCAAAHGIVGLTRAAALESANVGIRINAVCPGAVDAPMLDRMVGGDEKIKQQFGAALAIGRIATTEEVANSVFWLCSEEASYINGVALPLDGGGGA